MDEEEELIQELNYRYGHQSEEESQEERQRRMRTFLRGVALVFVLIFMFSLLGRWMQIFTWSPWSILEEARELEQNPEVEVLQRGVVELEVRRPSSRGEIRATGFNLCPQGLVITNRHVVENANSVRVSFEDHGSYGALDWEKSVHDDLALLELEPEPEDSLPALELAEKNAATGDEVMVIGNPMQLPRLPGEGKVVGFQELQEEGKDERDYPRDHPAVMALQASIHRGSSGSPVFDENHRVIGVIYATARQEEQEETIGLAVTVSALRRFLEDSGQELSF